MKSQKNENILTKFKKTKTNDNSNQKKITTMNKRKEKIIKVRKKKTIQIKKNPKTFVQNNAVQKQILELRSYLSK
jgi:hypothetical protein